MLSARYWRMDLLLQFFGIVLFAYSTGSLIMAFLLSKYFPIPLNKEYVMMIGGPLSFHVVILALIPWLLRVQSLNLATAFGITRSRVFRGIMIGLAVGVISLPVVFIVSQLAQYFLEAQDVGIKLQMPVETLKQSPSLVPRVLVFIGAVLLAPAAEEILFRGLLYAAIKQAGYPQLALWGTSVLFGCIHMNLMAALPLAVFALILALLYEATDNLLAPITAHAFFNLANYLYLVGSSAGSTPP